MKCPQCQANNFGWAKRCDQCGHGLMGSAQSDAVADRGRQIHTPSGARISLATATSAQIDALRVCWPFEVHDWPGVAGRYGLICRQPAREMMVVKFQQVDVPVATAQITRFQNRVLIALALRGYLQRGHRGLLMPCAYLRPKGGELTETGIAYLVGPHPDFKPASREQSDERWDAALGRGATAMVTDFALEVGRVIDQAPQGRAPGGASVGRPVFLTMELRPVTTLGRLDPRVAVLGPDVLVTMSNPESNFDSAWDFIARAGFSSLAHVDIAPGQLDADGSLHEL